MKGIWLKKQKRLFPKARKSIKRNIKRKKVLLKVSVVFFVVGRNRLVYFWGKGYEA